MARDNVQPNDKWEFDADVAACFDDMLERSIPMYATMRALATRLAQEYALKATRPGYVVDLGCSRGGALAPLVATLPPPYAFAGLEVSPPMLECARQRFRSNSRVTIRDHDIRQGIPADIHPVNAALSILTLQFIPINYRQGVLRDVYKRLDPGGALIIVEKVLGRGAGIDATMVRLYHESKESSGYTREDIDRKRASLEGVLVPVTADWSVEGIRDAGFDEVDCFWRWMNFAGWLAVKAE